MMSYFTYQRRDHWLTRVVVFGACIMNLIFTVYEWCES